MWHQFSACSGAGGAGNQLAELALADGRRLRARLVVGADGARSRTRQLAGAPPAPAIPGLCHALHQELVLRPGVMVACG